MLGLGDIVLYCSKVASRASSSIRHGRCKLLTIYEGLAIGRLILLLEKRGGGATIVVEGHGAVRIRFSESLTMTILSSIEMPIFVVIVQHRDEDIDKKMLQICSSDI